MSLHTHPCGRSHSKWGASAAASSRTGADFFDHADIEAILGADLKSKAYAAGQWLGFNPDFVYRHRPVMPGVSTAKLAERLACMTRRVDDYADKVGYDLA